MATTTATLSNFIDGESARARRARPKPVLNPATGEEIAQAPLSSAADVDRAVRAARARVRGWSQTTPAQRARRRCWRSPT